MSDLNKEIINYLENCKKVQENNLKWITTTGIGKQVRREINELDSMIKHLANGTNTSDRQLTIPDVSQQRELLLAFADYLRDEKNTKFIFTSWIDEFIKANNCG